jgi:tetratricopeptide (TPR) repeat protein
VIDKLLQILRTAEESPDAVELADALWLAEQLPELARTGPGKIPVQKTAAGSRAAAPVTREVRPPDGLADPASPLASMHLADPPLPDAPDAADDRPSHSLGGTLGSIPAFPALMGAAAIARALRPLRRRVDSATDGRVDEDATATRIADTGLWTAELRPAPERWLDLVLIVDDSASMTVWRHTIAEFQALLAQVAAFRDIHVVVINADQPTTVGALPGPASRRLVLMLSDCVGRAWSEGSLLRSLERISPLAIVQLLPQRLWARCGLAFIPVRISAESPGRFHQGRLRVELRNDASEPDGEGVSIPVLELNARWLGPWASMLAGQAAKPIAGMAVLTRSAPTPVPQRGAANAYERVTTFRSVASPPALRLASYLSAAPLSLPVMRLVQYVMLPQSRPADLAEVFLSGLLRRVSEPGRGIVEFEFLDGVREILLSALRRAEAIRVFQLVSTHIGERLGSQPDFPAMFTSGARDESIQGSLTGPFAALALTVLRSVGGQYREIADKLDKELTETVDLSLPGIAGPISAIRSPISITSTGGLTVPDAKPARPPALWRGVPPKNPNFTGRKDLLLALRSQLSAGFAALVPIALHGLGGVGKTQIAIEYVYRFKSDYDLICWISGEVPMQMRSSLAEIAPDLNIPAGGDLELTLAAVSDALRSGEPYSRWLLVVDNAENPAELMRYLPQDAGHVLITSRNQTWSGFAQTFPVGEFTREESISLIQRRGRGISEADADQLAERLGDLPIAIEQAAAWQAESGMPVQRYLTLLGERMSTLLTENPPQGYNLSVVAAWELAFDDLQRHSPEGAALVELCSFLGPEPIPYTLLWSFRHASGLPAELADMLQDDVHFHRAVRQVNQRALIKVDPTRETVTEHRLVQAVLRERLSKERQAEMYELVWRLLIVANPGRPDDQRNWETLTTINRHLRASGIIDAESKAAKAVVLDQIRFLYNRGDQVSSRELGEEVVRKWRVSAGASDEQTLIACRLLGIVRRELGATGLARELNEDTLNRTREVFGAEHEHTLVTANSYACDLRINDAYTEALELDEVLLEQHKAVFGDNDESTFRSAHNLAVDMRLNGRYREAYELDVDTLQRRREVIGDERWETWSSSGAVGRDLRGLGDFAASARLLAEAISRCSALLKPDHPEIVRMKMDYASTLRRLGRFEEARETAEECYVLNLGRLGRTHNYTLTVMTTLAEVLRLLGHAQSALELAEQLREAAPETYGEGHTLVTTCEHNYAIKLRAIGDNEMAYAIDRTVNERFHRDLGPRRRRTITSDMSLARDLELVGENAAAEDLIRKAVTTSEQIRGVDHPRTQFFVMNLARVLRKLDRDEEAEALAEQALSSLIQSLGAEHPEVLMAQAGSFIEFEMELPDR